MNDDVAFRFWVSDNYGLIRQRSGPGWVAHPEVVRKGHWVTGSSYVCDAITGMGEDPYSCGEWADEVTLEQAESLARKAGVRLYDPPDGD